MFYSFTEKDIYDLMQPNFVVTVSFLCVLPSAVFLLSSSLQSLSNIPSSWHTEIHIWNLLNLMASHYSENPFPFHITEFNFDIIGTHTASPLVNPWNIFSAMAGQYWGLRKHNNSIIYWKDLLKKILGLWVRHSWFENKLEYFTFLFSLLWHLDSTTSHLGFFQWLKEVNHVKSLW